MNTVRSLLILLISFPLAGCGPYIMRKVDDGLYRPDGSTQTVRRFFAYGKYCGGSYPPNLGRTGKDGNTRTLVGLSPPQDDLDALCYAHDHCYQMDDQQGIPANHVTCDSAFRTMVIKYQSDYRGKGCWNVATNITIAFFGKIWEKGNDHSETIGNRVAATTVGFPFALFWTVLKAPLLPFLSNPPVTAWDEPGTCNIGEKMDSETVIAEFEHRYLRGLFNDRRAAIDVPRPLMVTSEAKR